MGGFSRYSILAFLIAAFADSRDSAITANITCPLYRTSFSAKIGSSPNIGLESFLPGISFAQMTSTMPGEFLTSCNAILAILP